MPFKKITIDDVIDIKKENKKTITTMIGLFADIKNIMIEMKNESFLFEKNLELLKDKIFNQTNFTSIFKKTYDRMVDELINRMKIRLDNKLIKPNDDCYGKTFTYKINYKLSNHKLIMDHVIGIIDNITIFDKANGEYTIAFGCEILKLKLAENSELICYDDIISFINNQTDVLHYLNAVILQNLQIIDSGIEHINKLVNLYNLY